jgi:hypothetical protein
MGSKSRYTLLLLVIVVTLSSVSTIAASPYKPLMNTSRVYISASCANGAKARFKVDWGAWSSFFKLYGGGMVGIDSGTCWWLYCTINTSTSFPGSYDYHEATGNTVTTHTASCK